MLTCIFVTNIGHCVSSISKQNSENKTIGNGFIITFYSVNTNTPFYQSSVSAHFSKCLLNERPKLPLAVRGVVLIVVSEVRRGFLRQRTIHQFSRAFNAQICNCGKCQFTGVGHQMQFDSFCDRQQGRKPTGNFHLFHFIQHIKCTVVLCGRLDKSKETQDLNFPEFYLLASATILIEHPILNALSQSIEVLTNLRFRFPLRSTARGIIQ
jgi:hypothetical protein